MSEQEVRELAYHKWELAGRPLGDGLAFWFQAENELKSLEQELRPGKAAKKVPKPTKKQ